MVVRGDEDWLLLNAYADGELGDAARGDLERRLANEPHLSSRLQQVARLKAELRKLRTATAPSAPAGQAPPPRWRWSLTAAAAAAVVAAFAIALGALTAGAPTDPHSWLARAVAMHARLSTAAYVVEERHVSRIVSTGRTLEFHAPDLTGSRLFLVDIALSEPGDGEAVGLHYRGMHGCRLTIAAIESDGGAPSVRDAGPLVRTWSFDGFGFAVVANGMDVDRFNSVADYAQAALERDTRQRRDLRIAMSETYRNAGPCSAGQATG